MVDFIPGLQYTIPYKILINEDKTYNEKSLDLLRKFSWYSDVVILLPNEVNVESGTELVKYLKTKRIRNPKVTYIVYSPLISSIEELEGIVESM